MLVDELLAWIGRNSLASMIPARIIQTAKTQELNLEQRAFSANLRLLHPSYEWCFFDDLDAARFIDSEFPQYRKIFDSFEYAIQRFDFFRYLAVYRLGGFYFDLDVLLARDISELRSCDCVFPFEGLTLSRLLRAHGMDWEIGNYAFGASADHPFLKAVIDNCVRAQKEPGWTMELMRGVPFLSKGEYRVLYSTGPGVLSRTVAENPQIADDITVLFPDDVCDIRLWHRFGDIGVHLMDGSWRPTMSFLRRRIAQLLEHRTMNRRIIESRQRGPSRQVQRRRPLFESPA
jgi:hypothetical protein